MSDSYDNNNNNNNFIVRLRGLPWNTTKIEIENFLDGCKIRETNFIRNDTGRATGECFVVLDSQDDLENAKNFHQKNLGSRYIEVSESNSDDMSEMMKNNENSNTNSDNDNNDNWQEPVVRLRGLPYNSSKDDVTRFFEGLDIAQNGVHISASKPAGEAFVAFANMDTALRALDFNRMTIGHRYIEVFKSTYAEARASIMNDTQNMTRQRGGGGGGSTGTGTGTGAGAGGQNQSYGSNRSGNQGGYNNQYNGPGGNNYNSYSGNNNNNNSNNNNFQSSGVKRPMSISFTMKIRGVPFEAGEKEVFEFFNPIVPIRLEQENTPRGKPPIWYAEFGSREEATEALTYHKKYMGTRYIELLPLYDDLNRSKTART